MQRYFKLISVLIFLVFPFRLVAQDLHPELGSAWDSIRPMDAYNYCKKMAAAEFAGRLTGHEGYTKAANWAAEKFRQWGLKPINEETGYLQPYPSPYTVVDSARMTLIIKNDNSDQEQIELKLGEDFLPLLFTDSGDQVAELVFAGWGIQAPELNYDDYAGLDVKNKFVLCFRGTPDPGEKGFEKHDHHRYRMELARQLGALGLFYIYPEPIANPNGDWISGFTPAKISEKIADKIFSGKKISSAKLKDDLRLYRKPLSFPLEAQVAYWVVSRHFPKGIGYNIAGYVEGSDPNLRTHCVVIGGHFDHCGEHLGMLFAGANDNASGSAVVMEVAEAASKLERKPKRSLMFVLFGGEEKGLEGSNYFVDNLPEMCSKVDAMFNFDMTGAGDGTRCGYSVGAADLKDIILEADESVKTLRGHWEIKHIGVRSSDYAPFFLKGAVCASFFSTGPHLHYHQTGDTIYRINPDIMADIARLAFLSAFNWADR